MSLSSRLHDGGFQRSSWNLQSTQVQHSADRFGTEQKPQRKCLRNHIWTLIGLNGNLSTTENSF